MSRIAPGIYLDTTHDHEQVEVMGEGSDTCTGALFVVIRVPGQDRFKLIGHAKFLQPLTVMTPENTPIKVMRFVPTVEE